MSLRWSCWSLIVTACMVVWFGTWWILVLSRSVVRGELEYAESGVYLGQLIINSFHSYHVSHHCLMLLLNVSFPMFNHSSRIRFLRFFWKFKKRDFLRFLKCHVKQESRAAARKPRDAASVLFSWSSPTTLLTSIRVAMLRKPRFRAPNMLAQNTI